jgi:hypothetical protein
MAILVAHRAAIRARALTTTKAVVLRTPWEIFQYRLVRVVELRTVGRIRAMIVATTVVAIVAVGVG